MTFGPKQENRLLAAGAILFIAAIVLVSVLSGV